VVRDERGLAVLAGEHDESELVVEMRRFDESSTLAARLRDGNVSDDDVRRLARRLADFHDAAGRAPAGCFGPAQVAATVGENFSTLLEHADAVGPGLLAAGHRFAVAFLHARRGELASRSDAGRVRDCHGDLRAEHVIYRDDGVEVFDPVEFDPGLRLIDVAADLAFLIMELAEAGRDELGRALVDEYRRAGGDAGGDSLLAFYAAYRAWVRAKVACARADELPPGARRDRELEHAARLAEVARRFAWRSRLPAVLVVCGPSATGKTSLAAAAGRASGLPRLSSDVVRKELVGLGPADQAPASAYSEDMSLRTYDELGRRASAAVADGGALVDATFRRSADRAAFAAAYAGPEPLFVECRAASAVVAERARRRARDPHDASDATPAIAAEQLAGFEPLDEIAPERHLILRTDGGPDDALDRLEAALDAQLGTLGR
jgi:aminoglycoside phosphotransferase family enzyme/predicted kinase